MKANTMFKSLSILGLILALGVMLIEMPGEVGAQGPNDVGTAFTYQGQYTENGSPLNGTCDFEFELYSAETGGSQVGGTISKSVEVIDGLYTVKLSFGGNVFTGSARWLETRVQCPGASAYTNLGRQELTPTPYALALPALRTEGTWKQFSARTPNIIGGHRSNNVTDGAVGATISGGGDQGPSCFVYPFFGSCPNQVTDDYGTVSGGVSNRAGDNAGSTSDARWATVGGGYRNFATNDYATIGGGYDNITSGFAATVSGGYDNTATGDYSFAAGRQAQALHDGAFVWADDTEADFDSTSANQFLIRASGGVGIGTTKPAAQLDVAGRTRTGVLEITGGSDLAEPFEIAGAENVEPGMVVAIDPAYPGQLRIADKAYDRTVAGCVSGANGVNPGLTMQQEGTVANGVFPVALSGRVYCWADASFGAIQPGDLLTTSDTPGHVMKVTNYAQAQGAVIGKAMSGLAEGRELILVLVSLQ